MVGDCTGKKVSTWHAKSILMGITDAITKQHAVVYQGKAYTYQEFKHANSSFEPESYKIRHLLLREPNSHSPWNELIKFLIPKIPTSQYLVAWLIELWFKCLNFK